MICRKILVETNRENENLKIKLAVSNLERILDTRIKIEVVNDNLLVLPAFLLSLACLFSLVFLEYFISINNNFLFLLLCTILPTNTTTSTTLLLSVCWSIILKSRNIKIINP